MARVTVPRLAAARARPPSSAAPEAASPAVTARRLMLPVIITPSPACMIAAWHHRPPLDRLPHIAAATVSAGKPKASRPHSMVFEQYPAVFRVKRRQMHSIAAQSAHEDSSTDTPLVHKTSRVLGHPIVPEGEPPPWPETPAHPLLLTPGPVSVSASTKQVMMVDRSFGDEDFQQDVAAARRYLVGLIHGEGQYAAVPVPGSATYANEAAMTTLVPRGGKLLIHTNGVYGDRLIEIARALDVPARGDPHRAFQPRHGAAIRGGAGRRPGDHPRDGRALRDQHRRAEPAGAGRRAVPAIQQGATDRRRRLLRRDRDRCAAVALRRGNAVLQQMHAGVCPASAGPWCRPRRWRRRRATATR